MNCPICEKEITDIEVDTIEGSALEEKALCRDDFHFYYYEYFAGNSEETFNNVSMFWSYSQNREEQSELRFQRKAIVDLARKYYLRQKERDDQ